MKKINESQLAARVSGLRNYLAQLDEAGPYTAGKPVAPATGNSFDAKLNALGNKPAGASTAAAAPQSHWWDSFGKSQRTVAAQKDAAKKPTAVAHTKPAVTASAQAAPATPGTPAAATSIDAAKQAGADMNATPTAPEAPAALAADGGPAPTPEQLKWLGGANPNDPIILARMRAAVPDAPAVTASAQKAPAVSPAVPGVKAGGEVVDTRGGTAGQDEMEEAIGESTTFQNDELNRLVSLVQYR